MAIEQPPGCRSTWHDEAREVPGQGGTWTPARQRHGGTRFWKEHALLTLRLGESDRELLKQELASKLRRGQVGKLTYGRGRERDVFLMARVGDVLELRLSDVAYWPDDDPEGDPVSRHTRLYFTEPADESGVLLLLSITSKAPGLMGKAEQDRHIDDAHGRFGEHQMYRRTSQPGMPS